MKKGLILLVVVLMALGLAGCGSAKADQYLEIFLLGDGDWKVNGQMIILESDIESMTDDMEDTLKDLQDEMADQDITFSYRIGKENRNGDVPFTFSMSGTSLSDFSNTFFLTGSFSTKREDGTKYVVFNFYPITGSDDYDMQYILHGGSIDDTNGDQINRTTVVWENPDSMEMMEATLTEPRTGLPWWGILLIVLVVLGGIAVALFFFVVKRKPGATYPARSVPYYQQTPPAQPPAANGGVKFCTNCGAKVPVEATFCPQCGSKLSS